MIYLVDIDGTVADLTHRLHYIAGPKKDWKSFFAACPEDKPIPDVIDMVRRLRVRMSSSTVRVFMVTGRSDEVRKETTEWLVRHRVPFDLLYMRKAGDHREDSVVKSELLDKVIQDWPHDPIVGAFEDRQQVVDMYRSRGLRVYQVAAGNF